MNALRALAPPRLRPRPQHVRPQPRTRQPRWSPRTRQPRWAAPLEPQAQRTLAAWRADRASPAVSGMLCARTAAVKRQMDIGKRAGRISTDNASPRRHDGVRRALENQIRARRR